MPTFKCIVTGHNDKNKSCIAVEKLIESNPVFGLTDFWHTSSIPASIKEDGLTITNKLEPPKNGTLFRFFQIPPESASKSKEEYETLVKQAFDMLGASHCLVDTTLHPLMHKTASIDYIVVLQGKITLMLDEGEIALEPFDTVVQRGTNHSWINRGNEPALLMAVLVDAK